MKKVTQLVAVCVAVLVAADGQPQSVSAGTLDQSFDAFDTGSVGGGVPTDFSAISQTFTVGLSGLLSQVDIQLRQMTDDAPDNDITLRILGTSGGLPDLDNVLGSAVISRAAAPPFTPGVGGFVSVDVSSLGIFVTEGDVLALELRYSGNGRYVWLEYPDDNPDDKYVGGSVFTIYIPGPTITQQIADAGFQTWVETPAEFTKEIVAGPDRDNDGEIDRVVGVRAAETSEYVFKITFNQPNLPPALVQDIVPREWEVMSCVPSNPLDLVVISPLGRLGKSATRIDWFPTNNNSCLECTIQTRPQGGPPRPGRPRRNPRFEPNKCGPLVINPGAAALDTTGVQSLMDENGSPLVSPALCLVALRDQNRDGVIDYTGNGDEDGDTLTDYAEACILGTDPCDADTDGDGSPDNTDSEPLDRAVM